MEEQIFMEKQFGDLPLTENFCLRSKLMGYKTLQDIVKDPVKVLIGKEDFSYNWLGELVRLLNENQLLHRLQR